MSVLWIHFFTGIPIKFCCILCHVLVQFIKIDIGKYRTDDATLRCPVICVKIFPIFDVPCIQEFTDKPNETDIVDAFFEDSYHHIVIDVVKESLYIALNVPFYPTE